MELLLNNLQKSYTVNDTINQVLNGIDLKFTSGEFVFIKGASGSGKTTLLNLLAGFLQPDSGKVMYKFSDRNTSEPKPNDIGYIFQDYYLLNHLTVYENICVRYKNQNEFLNYSQNLEYIITRLGVDDILNKYPWELSGGQIQRVAIARALADSPQIIMGDEITGNLDSELSENLIQLLQTYQQSNNNVIIILVSHDVDLMQKGMRVINLKNGKISQDYIH